MASKQGAKSRRKMENNPAIHPDQRDYFRRLNAAVGWSTTTTSTTTTTTTTTTV